jgi:tRNA-splicing ligase RtcB
MELKKLNDYTWEIPKSGAMNVPGRIYASAALMDKMKLDKTLSQVQNVACLPGILKYSYAMPDAHQGYGFSIGGVAAFDVDEGIISPGGVGYDINCSVRLLRTDLTKDMFLKGRSDLIDSVFKAVPAGVGRAGSGSLGRDDVLGALEGGAQWAVKNGFGSKDDFLKTEESGMMPTDLEAISPRALKRGSSQLGTLGSGNHFFEVQEVEKIYDEETAKVFGFTEPGQVTVMIHCGSRGLGHQVASDYIRKMEDKYGFEGLPDRELINAPIQSELGQQYYKAMGGAANFGFANKQIITHLARESFKKTFGSSDGMDVVYDVCHNIAKMEKHSIDGEERTVCVHRKGATRSFGPGRPELPEVYRKVGQPVIIPGSMGTASYVLAGTKESAAASFGSTAHGAGRVLSRSQALRQFKGEDVTKDLAAKGIQVKGTSMRGIAEETYQAYKTSMRSSRPLMR